MEQESSLLIETFKKYLLELIVAEKAWVTRCAKLSEVAFSGELCKALSPEATEAKSHRQRLLLIAKSMQIKIVSTSNSLVPGEEDRMKKMTKRKASIEQDVDIISLGMSIQHLRMGKYEYLHTIAKVLELEPAGAMLEQSTVDHKQTQTWLRQILLNVVGKKLD